MKPTSFEAAAELLGAAIASIADIGTDSRSIEAGLAVLGWAAPPGVDLVAAFSLDLGDVVSKLQTLRGSTPEERDDDALMMSRYADLAVAVTALMPRLDAFAAALPGALAAAGDYADKTKIATELPRRLLDYVLVVGLQSASSTAAAFLHLAGVLRVEQIAADASIYQVDHQRVVVDAEQLPRLLSDPASAFRGIYGWGTPSFDAERLLNDTGLVLQKYVPASLSDMPERAQELIGQAATGMDSGPLPQLLLHLAHLPSADLVDTMLSLHRLRATSADGSDAGVELAVYIGGAAALTIPLTDALHLVIDGELDASDGVAIAVRPTGAELRSGLLSRDPRAVSGDLCVGLLLVPRSEGLRHELLSGPYGIAITFDTAVVQLGVRKRGDEPPDAYVRAALTGCKLSVSSQDADSFLQRQLPTSFEVDFDIGLRWSQHDGLTFEGSPRGGSASIDWRLPIHLTVGPITLDEIHLRLEPAGSQIKLMAGLTASFTLGPAAAIVRDIGARATIAVTRGNLGPVDIAIGFQPPNAAGLAIDAGVVSGGGFLLFDEAAGQYAGVFELTIANVVSVKAIALINTKFPDGRPGFALLILITAEGFTPIQLGMGFSLTGIGGLLALNRTLDADAVRGGLRDGVLDSILFAKDPIKNANRILATMDAIFPLAADRFLIGPLVEISWGAPLPLVKIRIALLLEIPKPVRVILLAALSLMLPKPEAPIVELHVDAIGVLDFGRGELSLDASLHDSRLLTFSLTGDMALRINWGDEPMFLLSVGGFHPRFPPPRGLRPLNRMALTLTDGENPRVRFESYLAITSNTIQMGASVTLYWKAGDFGIDGGGAFDALIQWDPFGLDVAFAMWVRLFGPTGTLLALSLRLNVTGPAPWHITGEVSLQILFFRVSVAVDLTIGSAIDPKPTEQIDVIQKLLRPTLATAGNWASTPPPDRRPSVTVGPPPGGHTVVLASPDALVTFRQKLVPLETEISRVGAALAAGGSRTYSLNVSGGHGLPVVQVRDLFARGQYTDLDDDAQLAQPSFEPLPSGFSLAAPDEPEDGPSITCDFVLETAGPAGPTGRRVARRFPADPRTTRILANPGRVHPDPRAPWVVPT